MIAALLTLECGVLVFGRSSCCREPLLPRLLALEILVIERVYIYVHLDVHGVLLGSRHGRRKLARASQPFGK